MGTKILKVEHINTQKYTKNDSIIVDRKQYLFIKSKKFKS